MLPNLSPRPPDAPDSVTHSRRQDGRPFRMVDVNPRPVPDILSDLKVTAACPDW